MPTPPRPPRAPSPPPPERVPTPPPEIRLFGEYAGDAATAEAPLSWRQDKTQSFSDWTIVVKQDGGDGENFYNVHKTMLAAGLRPSSYFVRCFNSSMAESASSTTTLTLQQSSAAAFPIYLDFAYTGELNATSATACALLHLADYLGCRALHEATIKFAKVDLSQTTCAVYLREASLYRLEKAEAAAFKLCSSHFKDLDIDESLHELSPELFLKVIRDNAGGFTSAEVSVCVAQYCRGPFAEVVDANLLEELTATFTDVHPTVAYALLELASKHKPLKDGPNFAARCIAACTEHWEEALVLKLRSADAAVAAPDETVQRKRRRGEEAPDAPLGRVVPDVMQIKILECALMVASGDLKKKDEEAKALKAEVEKLKQQKADAVKIIRRFHRVPHTWAPTGMDEDKLADFTYAPGDSTILNPYYAPRLQKRKYGRVPPMLHPCPGLVEPTDLAFSPGWIGSFPNAGIKSAMFYFV